MPTLQYPLINGALPSFADIKMSLLVPGSGPLAMFPNSPTAGSILGITRIDYRETNDTRPFHLTGPYPLAVPRGNITANGSITWPFEVIRLLARTLASLGAGGFGDVRFLFFVTYARTQTSPIIQDNLYGVRILGLDQANETGGEQITTTSPLVINWIGYDEGNATLAAPLQTT